ncbi:MAG: monofunctional biosynthetic peptidoglycan transglycosylase [Pseudomonadota bacterium]
MAKAAAKKTRKKQERKVPWPARAYWTLRKWLLRAALLVAVLACLWIAAYRWIDPSWTFYMRSQERLIGEIDYVWTDLDEMAPVMARSAVAAEDANFCLHWGLDLDAIILAAEDGAARGGSTISQQVVKNLFLWHGRSWLRKGLEALMTPVMELLWPKRRIIEMYLNIAEFDEGVFGVEAMAQRAFGVDPKDLSAQQTARMAAVLPAPKDRSVTNPSPFVRRRAASIRDGAATIAADGRSACFEDN